MYVRYVVLVHVHVYVRCGVLFWWTCIYHGVFNYYLHPTRINPTPTIPPHTNPTHSPTPPQVACCVLHAIQVNLPTAHQVALSLQSLMEGPWAAWFRGALVMLAQGKYEGSMLGVMGVAHVGFRVWTSVCRCVVWWLWCLGVIVVSLRVHCIMLDV